MRPPCSAAARSRAARPGAHRPGGAAARHRAVRRGGRLRRGGPAPVGQLGGRRRDPRRGHRALHRPRQAALHRLRRGAPSASRVRRSPRGRRRGSRCRRAGPRRRAVPARRPARADIGFVTPRDAAQARAIVAEIRAGQEAGGRASRPSTCSATSSCSSTRTPAGGRRRKARLDALSGLPYRSDAPVFAGTPAAGRLAAGLAGGLV